MRRRQGKEEVSYPHPSLEETLKRTLGVPLFQEQLLRMAMVVANFSGAEAEELRKAVGMRRSMARMKELESKMRAGMTLNKLTEDQQQHIIQSMQSFALYGFPESHAASFALIAYASAYLKVRYLGAFTCAILNNQPMGFYSPAVLVKDAQRHGLRIKPVDLQQSAWDCTLEPEEDGTLSLRLGLRYVKGLQTNHRRSHGPHPPAARRLQVHRGDQPPRPRRQSPRARPARPRRRTQLDRWRRQPARRTVAGRRSLPRRRPAALRRRSRRARHRQAASAPCPPTSA